MRSLFKDDWLSNGARDLSAGSTQEPIDFRRRFCSDISRVFLLSTGKAFFIRCRLFVLFWYFDASCFIWKLNWTGICLLVWISSELWLPLLGCWWVYFFIVEFEVFHQIPVQFSNQYLGRTDNLVELGKGPSFWAKIYKCMIYNWLKNRDLKKKKKKTEWKCGTPTVEAPTPGMGLVGM